MGGVRQGGHILVDQLRELGCRRTFLVPGESFLPVLDALHDATGIETTVCRQEGGAAMMAEAYGKLTGMPGVLMVSRGPDATNASAGIHVAQQDSTPLVVIVGQVPLAMQGREAFQEMDLVAFFSPLAKWVAQVNRVEQIPEYLLQAWQRARSGRPGPVVLIVPEDVLSDSASVTPLPGMERPVAHCSADEIRKTVRILEGAERPLLLLGGPGWSQDTAERLQRFAERNHLPVAATFRCQDYFYNRHPCYVGDVGLGINPGLAKRVKEADAILAIGARLGEATTSGYTLLEPPVPRQKLVHVYPQAEELGRVYRPTLAVQADSADFVAALSECVLPDSDRWTSELRLARREYESWNTPEPTPGDCRLEDVVSHLNEVLPESAIITNGAGNYAAWVHRYYRYRRYGTQLAPRCGSMGYGLPAAVAARLEHPGRPVICFAGDGCFLMHGQELATAVQYGANIIVIVANNGMYGTIRMHQERRYPGRVSATELRNPDFAALAESYGALGMRVTHSDRFPEAFRRATESERPVLIELILDPEALTPRETLSAIRQG
ncbi:MAG: thiamine pyrophosphate-binding protein [Gammaproteobacteria bacterium]